MLETKKKHCAFPKLNRDGRCIAACWRNVERERFSDCTGKPFKAVNEEARHEVRVSVGFIDGRNVDVDERGYRIVSAYKPIVNRGAWGRTYYEIQAEREAAKKKK